MEQQGIFSVSYRLAMGFAGLVGPFILFAMPGIDPGKDFPGRKVLALSLLATACFWAGGTLVLGLYFHVAELNPAWLPRGLAYFSVLLLGVFFTCLRTPYVARMLMAQQYRTYFMIHAAACLPVLLFSWIAGRSIAAGWVPLLACVPDALATAAFAVRFHTRPGLPKPQELNSIY